MALPAVCIVFTRRFLGHRHRLGGIVSMVAAALFVLSWMLAGVGFDQHPTLVDRAGLLQRIAIGSAFRWLTGLAAAALGSRSPRGSE